MVTISEYPKAIWISILILFMLICFEASEIEAQSTRIPDDESKRPSLFNFPVRRFVFVYCFASMKNLITS